MLPFKQVRFEYHHAQRGTSACTHRKLMCSLSGNVRHQARSHVLEVIATVDGRLPRCVGGSDRMREAFGHSGAE